MFKDNGFRISFRSCVSFYWLSIFFVAALGTMLPLVYPFLSKAAPTSSASANGVLEICNVASGTGLEDRIFRFQIGSDIYQVPIGGCSAPITLPAGSVTVQELIDGLITPQGTFSGRFRLLDVSSNVSGAISNLNLSARTVTVNIREGDTTNPTKLTFTNTFAILSLLEICNYPSEPGVSGNFNFTIDALSNTVITVPVGGCSAPIQINVPTVSAPITQPAQIKVTQLGRAGFELNTVRTFPANRFNSLTLRSGINNTSPKCIKTTDPVGEGCAFINPGGGYADVDVLEGGIHWMTTVVFSNSFRSTVSDFDGDGKSDISVFRPSDGFWYILKSSDGFSSVKWGLAGDAPVPRDYDGDGRADVAVHRMGDFRNDAYDSFYYIIRSSDNSFLFKQWGRNTGFGNDIPVPADYDGDGKADIASYHNSDGAAEPSYFRILQSSNDTTRTVKFGLSTDKLVPADYDGDGKADIAVWRASDRFWYRLNSSDGSFVAMQFGLSQDKPTPADYDGDGKTDIAVFRPSSGTWYIQRSTEGFLALQFGLGGDIPIPNTFVR